MTQDKGCWLSDPCHVSWVVLVRCLCAGFSCAFLHTPGAEGDWPLHPVPPWQAVSTDSLLFVIWYTHGENLQAAVSWDLTAADLYAMDICRAYSPCLSFSFWCSTPRHSHSLHVCGSSNISKTILSTSCWGVFLALRLGQWELPLHFLPQVPPSLL